MKTPVEILLAVANIGGELGIRSDGLLMRLPRDCSPDLKAAIRQHKSGLLELLKLNFLVVRADTVNDVLLWAPDESTKARLVAAGGDPGRTYTPDELAALVNRRITIEDLPAIHEAKRVFNGKIRP